MNSFNDAIWIWFLTKWDKTSPCGCHFTASLKQLHDVTASVMLFLSLRCMLNLTAHARTHVCAICAVWNPDMHSCVCAVLHRSGRQHARCIRWWREAVTSTSRWQTTSAPTGRPGQRSWRPRTRSSSSSAAPPWASTASSTRFRRGAASCAKGKAATGEYCSTSSQLFKNCTLFNLFPFVLYFLSLASFPFMFSLVIHRLQLRCPTCCFLWSFAAE